MLVKFNHGALPDSTWNASSSSSGTLVADLIDDTTAATGISLAIGGSQSFSNTAGRATSAHYGLPIEFWNDIVFNTSSFSLTLAGLTAYNGQSYTITIAGFSKSGSVRTMDFDVDGGTAQLYSSQTSEPPDTPIILTGTISADSLVINNTLVSGLSVSNGFTLELTGAGPTVAQADTTPEDGVLQSFTSTGLTGSYSASTLSGKALTLNNTDPTTASTYTLDVSAVTASEGMPRVGETSTLSVTATGGTATTDVVIQPKTGWTTVTLAGALDKTASGFLHSLDADLGLTSAVGDIIYYSNARGEAITATGVYTGGTTVAYQSTAFVIQQGGSATTTATSEGDAFYPFGTGPVVDAPVLASTKSLSGITDSSFSKTLTIQSGDAATSWAINGGADQAEYTLSNAGVLARTIPNPLEEAEVVTVAATNSGGTSNTQTVTITYSTSTIPKTKFRRFPWQSWNPL